MILLVHDRRQREGRLEGRLVEGREHPACVGRLELSHRIASLVRFAEIQAPQIAVENSVVADADLHLAGGDRGWHLDGRLLLLLVERHLRRLRPALGGDPHVLERNLGRVQHDRSPRGWRAAHEWSPVP